MRCGKYIHQPGQRCPTKNAKCKDCHKIGHSTKCARANKETTSEPTLFRAPKMKMTSTLMKMSQMTQSTPKGKYA